MQDLFQIITNLQELFYVDYRSKNDHKWVLKLLPNSLFQDLDIGAQHIKLYLNSTLVYEGELEKGCGNQDFDYSTTIDLKNLQVSESVFSSPVSSGYNLGGVSPLRHNSRNGRECSTGSTHSLNPQLSDTADQAMMDMQERSHTLLPPIAPTPMGASALTRRSSTQKNSSDNPASEEPLSLRQQVEQPALMEHTVTTQPSSSRVAPQWLQPLNRGPPEGCEASREKPLWLVPQHSAEPKTSSTSSSSMLPDLPCNPGRVCRGGERTVNGGLWKANSLDLSCDLMDELGEPKPDRPISGRRSSFRNTAVSSRQTGEQHHRDAELSNTGRK